MSARLILTNNTLLYTEMWFAVNGGHDTGREQKKIKEALGFILQKLQAFTDLGNVYHMMIRESCDLHVTP